MTTIACVRTGAVYGIDYVARLRRMVERHLDREHNVICLTDHPVVPSGVEPVDIAGLGLPGWWGKMKLFDLPAHYYPLAYLDLDTVVVGDLAPLVDLQVNDLAICENFTRLAGHASWPCRYGSCAMVIGRPMPEIWHAFWGDRDRWMRECPRGDQEVIEKLWPDATLLQDALGDDYFLNKRDLPRFQDGPPPRCSVVVFGGSLKPHNCGVPWVRDAWG